MQGECLVHRSQAIDQASRGVDIVDIVRAYHCDGRGRIGDIGHGGGPIKTVQQRVGEAMWPPCRLVCQRHDAGHQRGRQAGATDSILVVQHVTVGECLRLAHQVSRVGITERRNVRHGTARTSLRGKYRRRNDAHLILGFCEHAAHAAAAAVQPGPGRSRRPRRSRPAARCGAPTGLEQVIVRGADTQTGAANRRHERAGRRPVGRRNAKGGGFVAVVAR